VVDHAKGVVIDLLDLDVVGDIGGVVGEFLQSHRAELADWRAGFLGQPLRCQKRRPILADELQLGLEPKLPAPPALTLGGRRILGFGFVDHIRPIG
jgi:hypothetical protein